MLDLSKMTPGDARHSLNVLAWLFEKQDELRAIAERASQENEVAIEDVAQTFHQEYTEIISQRFFPFHLSLFTDQDALDQGATIEPSVLLTNPTDDHKWIIPDHFFQPVTLVSIANEFGIAASEQTWRKTDGSIKHE